MRKNLYLLVLAIFAFAISSKAQITGITTVCTADSVLLSDTCGGTWESENTAVAIVNPVTGEVTGVAAGTATIILVPGCTGEDTVMITVHAGPGAISPHDPSICVGNTQALTDAPTGGTWVSSNTSTATIGSGGTVTGVAVGTTVISYTYNSCLVRDTVTVGNGSGTISPTTAVSICVGSFADLTSSSGGGTWSSGNTLVATVSSGGDVYGVSGGTAIISYALASPACPSTKIVTVTALPAITPRDPTVCAGSIQDLTDATSGGTWFSSSTATATVSSGGAVTGVAAGTVVISYTYSSCLTRDTVTVATGGGTISPTSAVSICIGSSYILTGSGGGAWSSSNTGIATVNSTGTVYGAGDGTTTILYTVGSCAASKVVTVDGPVPFTSSSQSICTGGIVDLTGSPTGGTWSTNATTVASVTSGGVVNGALAGTAVIEYALSSCVIYDTVTVNNGAGTISPSGVVTVCEGSGSILTDLTTGGNWTSNNTAIATVNSSGTVTGAGAGTTTITYTVGTCYTTTTVSVVASSSISPSTASVCVGSTTPLTESGSGLWSSDNTTVATVSSTGVVSGVAAGTATISYSIYSGATLLCNYTADITVNTAPVGITPATAVTICSGGATVTLADATTGGTWSSSNTAIATVSSSGAVGGVSGGTATISYNIGSCSATKVVTITAGPAAISPSSSSICTGTTGLLTDATSGGVWSSNTTSVATVASGTVHGVSAGTATISYVAGTCYSIATVTVNSSPVAITPTGATAICNRTTTTLAETTTGGVWSTSNSAVATITTGSLTGVSAGTATISYSVGSCYATKTVTILAAPAALSPAAPVVCTGTTLSLTESTSGGTWSSSTTSAATVSSSGVVFGATAGTTIINYLSGSCSATVTVTVVSAPSAITPSPVTICEGSTTTLSDATSGGAWSSSATSIATVSSEGLVSGIASGTATITYAEGLCYVTQVVNISVGPAAILPASPTVCTGNTISLTDAVSGGTWSSSSSALATVSTAGIVTGVSAGTVNIYYIIGSCVATTSVVITQSPSVGTISGTTSLCLGSTIPLTDAATGGVWSSSNTAVASVSGTGVVYGLSIGTALISYSNTSSCGLIATTHIVTVNTSPSAGTITGTTSFCAGTTSLLSNTVTGGTWAASNANASVGLNTGLLTGVTPGTDTITYRVTTSCGTISTTAVITVGSYLSAGTITGSSATICGGTTLDLADATASGTGTWSSSNSSATVSSAGIVTGATGGGIDTITYTATAACGTATTIKILTINPAPVSGTISGVSAVCIGTSATLTESATDGTWSASNGDATVADGLVTGVSAGTDIISYSVSNSCGTSIATVNITVSSTVTAGTIAGTGSVCPGAPVTLTDAASGGAWSSSNTAVASVSSSGTVSGLSAGSATISYTVASSCGTAVATFPVTVSGTTLTAGSIVAVSDVCVGSYSIFTDAATGGIWTSSNSHATVTSGGLVTGISTGIDTISYTVTNSCGTAVATQVVTISGLLTAGAISGEGNVCISSPVTLTESVSDGVWSSSNANATVNSAGLVTGLTAGLDTIYYTVTTSCGTASASFEISVNSTGPSAGTITGGSGVCLAYPVLFTNPIAGGVWSISNTHATISSTGLVTGITAGVDTIRYTVSTPCGTAYTTKTITIGSSAGVSAITGSSTTCTGWSINLNDATASGTWSSSDANATVSGGTVTGVTAGTAIISYSVTYSCGVASVMKTVTVNPSSGISSISGADTVCQGTTITLTEATTGGVWSSGNTNASVTGGVVTGITAGTAPISYTVSNSTCGTISAVSAITIAPSTASGISPITSLSIVCVGSGITLTDATPGGTWVASNGNAIVVGAGIIDGVIPGIDTISYEISGSCGIGAAIKILSVDTIPIVPAITGSATQCIGSASTLGDPTLGGIWTTSTSAVGTVNEYTGVVTGLSAGTTTITYTVTNVFGCPGSITITDLVTPPTVTTGISGSASVCADGTTTLSNITTGGTWSSSNTSVATIDPVLGVVTGLTAGTTTIIYTIVNTCGTSFVSQIETVSALPSVAAISGAATGCIGSAVALSDATAGGTWSSSNTAIATVDGSGNVTGIISTTVLINYTVSSSSGCSTTVSTSLFINPAPAVAAISGTASECAGSITSLADGTGGGTWSSSNTAIAIVDGSGNVTGVSAGTVTISYSIAGSGGCVGSATVTDVVNAIPATSPITGMLDVCAGANTPLGNSIAGGSWSSGNTSIAIVNAMSGVVTGISGGTDEIYYSVSNSCGTAVSDSASITVYPGPAIDPISAAYTAVCTGNMLDVTDAVAGGTWGITNSAIASVTSAGVVTGITTGTDTVYYVVTDSHGCSSGTILSITIGGAIGSAVVTPAGAIEMCNGQTESMQVAYTGSGVTYQWTRNASIISGATDTSYTTSAIGNYAVIVSNGSCSETVNGPAVTAPAIPVIAFIGPDVLYTGTFHTYQWYRNGVLIPGATGNTLDESAGGLYTVVVTDAAGCSDTSSGYTLAGGTGINGLSAAQDIKVYPNPATSMIHIDAAASVNISVMSVDGQLVIEQKNATDINVSTLADGMYMILVYDQSGQLLKTAKFAKVD